MKNKFIELRGVGFVNKGAELMLMAIIRRVLEEFPEVKFLIEPKHDRPYGKRASLGLYQKLVIMNRNGIDYMGLLADFIPGAIRSSYGLVRADEVGVVLDASGFAYSDQFGAGKTRIAANEYKRMKRNGTAIVLLPQAFGPFTSDLIKTRFKKLAGNVDLMFARDEISYSHVIDTIGPEGKVLRAPDFTNLVEGFVPDGMDHLKDRVCIIPNSKMEEQVSSMVREYVEFISICIRKLVDAGENPFILIHERGKDLPLVRKIVDSTRVEIDIVDINDPLAIKGVIGISKGVISSRFHGLVSALSQAVPALATGWSHKYQMLFDDYGFSDGCISIDLTEDEIKEQIHHLIDTFKRGEIINNLKEKSERQKKLSLQMWEEVFKLIRNKFNQKNSSGLCPGVK